MRLEADWLARELTRNTATIHRPPCLAFTVNMAMFILHSCFLSFKVGIAGEGQQFSKVKVLYYRQLSKDFGLVHLDHALIDFCPRFDL